MKAGSSSNSGPATRGELHEVRQEMQKLFQECQDLRSGIRSINRRLDELEEERS